MALSELDNIIEDLANAIYPHYTDRDSKNRVRDLLVMFANETIRRSIEP